jgi:hypothetical protein
MMNGGHDIKVYGFAATHNDVPTVEVRVLDDGGVLRSVRFHPVFAQQIAKAIVGAAQMATQYGGDSRVVIDPDNDNFP